MPPSVRTRISLFRPVIREDAIDAVAEVLRSGWLGTGPRTREFEDAFSSYVDARDCVAMSSGTAALQIAVRMLDLPPGSEVVTTALTFVASNQVIVQEGLQPVFADIDPTTGNVDSASVAECLTDRTGALLLVHYGGYPCDLEELYALATERRVAVIEDCAHACGAVYRGRRIGSHGDLPRVLLSRGQEPADRRWRGAHRPIPGPGGAGTTAPLVRHQLRHVRARKRWVSLGLRRHRARVQVPDERHPRGARPAQLGHVDADNARRAEIAAQYRAGLDGVPGIELLRSEPDRTSSFHLFCALAERRTISWTRSPSAASTSACITGRATCIRCSPPAPSERRVVLASGDLAAHARRPHRRGGGRGDRGHSRGLVARAGRFAPRSRHEDARARDR